MGSLDQKLVAEICARAGRRWPLVKVDSSRFSEVIEVSVAAGVPLESLHAEDLFLVTACLDRQPEALAFFEGEVIAAVRTSVLRACREPSAVDDALQSTREKLLVGQPPEGAKLAQYTGRGELIGWVRVVAVREALQAVRKSKRERVSDDLSLLEGASSAASFELSLLKDLHAGSFRSAVQDALRQLTPEQRTILRFHAKDGLSIDKIAPMLGVHRATAARRLEKARADALDHTRTLLRERLGLSESEARSLCIALGSEVDVSIGRALTDDVSA